MSRLHTFSLLAQRLRHLGRDLVRLRVMSPFMPHPLRLHPSSDSDIRE